MDRSELQRLKAQLDGILDGVAKDIMGDLEATARSLQQPAGKTTGIPAGLTPGVVVPPPVRKTPVQRASCVPAPTAAPTAAAAPWTPVDPWTELPDSPRAPAGAPKVDAKGLAEVLGAYGVSAEPRTATTGPTVTTYVMKVPVGSKVSSVVSREADLARDLGVSGVRVLDRVAGHPGCIGVEIPNTVRAGVGFRDMLLGIPEATPGVCPSVALGVDSTGRDVWRQLSDFPHLLVAGTTGSGKSVFLHGLVCSLVARHSPEDVKLVLVDPKRVEFGGYAGIPHLARGLARTADEAREAVDYLVAEMDQRYALLEKHGARDIAAYNAGNHTGNRLPYILAVVDEYSDLMMSGGRKNGIEDKLVRIAQLARAVGIHMVLATQRPTVDVVTGQIRSNLPARAVFRVSSAADSRVVLDPCAGSADTLLGKGDCLYSDSRGVSRLQGVDIDPDTRDAITQRRPL